MPTGTRTVEEKCGSKQETHSAEANNRELRHDEVHDLGERRGCAWGGNGGRNRFRRATGKGNLSHHKVRYHCAGTVAPQSQPGPAQTVSLPLTPLARSTNNNRYPVGPYNGACVRTLTDSLLRASPHIGPCDEAEHFNARNAGFRQRRESGLNWK
eukprot:2806059-Rhodomonas_salina.1